MSYEGEQQKLNTTAFGEVLVASPSGRIQLQGVYGINPDIISASATGAGISYNEASFIVLDTTAAINSSSSFTSLNNLHYRGGQGAACLFTTVFTQGVDNSQQYAGLGDSVDGFFVGFNGSSFGILHRNNSVDTWIPQTSWNVDKCDGTGSSGVTLIPTFGNVFKIQFQWLGFGVINFFLENGNTGSLFLCHQIRYANSNLVTSLTNPSLPLHAKVINTSNSLRMKLKIPSMAAFIEGNIYENDLRNCINATRSGVSTNVNILTIRCDPTFNSKINKKVVIPDYISLSNSGTPDAIYKITLNPTIAGTPVFNNVSLNNSCVSFDIAGTSLTSGRLLFTVFVNGNQQQTLSLDEYNININPNDRLCISGASSGANIVCNVALGWKERF